MFGSAILDFAIGLVFTFLAMSLAAGAATEAVSSIIKWRSRTLMKGVQELLNDKDFNGLAHQVYQHGLINPRGDGAAPQSSSWWTYYGKSPAYIDPAHFAAALVDTLKTAGAPAGAGGGGGPPDPAVLIRDLKAAFAPQLRDNAQLKRMMDGIIERAEGKEEQVRAELASWFDNAMDRVSGVYKRWSQLVTFLLAFVLAALLNVSTIDVATTMWKQPVDTKALTDLKGTPNLQASLKQLDSYNLPIGWPAKLASPSTPAGTANSGTPATGAPAAPGAGDAAASGSGTKANANGDTVAFNSLFDFLGRFPGNWASWLLIFGWLITAFATLFGAPFWFDALQQIVRLKGSGPSPGDKATNTAAANGSGKPA